MFTTSAIIRGDRQHLLGLGLEQHPVALQIGGSDAAECAKAARIGEELGYGEINLNVGCPSDRVQSGSFGACLMAKPELVADCTAAMIDAVNLPVSVKCRIGIDDQDEDADLDRFVDTVAQAGCRIFIIHARKAWLKGLSAKQNRDIPPLNYERVYRLKARRPDLEIIINGAIGSLGAAQRHLEHVDGVMLGRAAYQIPWILAAVDPELFGVPAPVASRKGALQALLPHIERHIAQGGQLNHVARHLLGLFHGEPGARTWRRYLSKTMHLKNADSQMLLQAAEAMAHLETRASAGLDPHAKG